MGIRTSAETLSGRATAIIRAALGEGHRSYADSLRALAEMHQYMGESEAAAPLYRQAMEIRRVALGEGHPEYARSLLNLAMLCKEMGDCD